MMTDSTEMFRGAMRAAGIDPPHVIEADGQLHRFSTNGAGSDKAGWYVLHVDSNPAGSFGCWRRGIKHKWCARRVSEMTPNEREEYQHRIRNANQQARAKFEPKPAQARARAKGIWAKAKPATDENPYLQAKGVKAHRIHTDGKRLIVPVRNADNKLRGLQFIAPDGDKKNLSGTRKTGCYHLIGRPKTTLCIAEGYATGASIFEATGHPVAIAFDTDNLKPVAEALHRKYPHVSLVICADDDQWTKGNPGVTKATEAARVVDGAKVAIPHFKNTSDRPTDFNDLMRLEGLKAVRKQLARARTPKPKPEIAASTIKRLAALSSIDYDRVREAEAKQLSVRLSTLDTLVEQHRKSVSDASSGQAVSFSEPKPWSKPVDGTLLLDALADTFSRYLVLPTGAADALALWTVHTHVYSAFEYTPRLNVTGPVKQCGKTLLMDVLQTLVASGLRAENLSTAVLFRLVDAKKPTLLIDEYDSFLRGNEELRGALNAGQKRGGQVLRCAGDDHEVRGFNVFAPVALAGIGPLPGTLADRSIIIRMERAKRGEVQARFDSRITDREQKIKRKLMRWVQDNRHLLEACDPEMPGLYNRRADTWRPLFAIAEVAGGSWPQRVRAANKALENKTDENESAGVMLLADIRRIFKKSKQDTLSSIYLVERLQQMEERPWPEFKCNKPITMRQVADLLRPFDIGPRTQREGDETFKGYTRHQFKRAFSRYLNVPGTRSRRASSSDDSIRSKKRKKARMTKGKRNKQASAEDVTA